MAIKVPDNFRQSDYGVELSIPKPDIDCKKNEDGSFSLRVGYNFDCISELAREAAREMYDKIEAELMDELLRLNGYVPERTCKNITDGYVPFHCSKCDCVTLYDDFRETGIMAEMGMLDAPNYCPNCGAKVVI